MLALRLASRLVATVPPSTEPTPTNAPADSSTTTTTVATEPVTTDPPSTGGGGGGGGGGGSDDGQSLGTTTWDVLTTMWDNLRENGYQTGVSLIVATIAVVMMLNMKIQRAIMIPVGIGAFWAGWLLFNTVAAQSNPLFPGEVSATKIWDVAFSGQTGFLVAVGVGCIAAITIGRGKQPNLNRLVLISGTVLGASFVYNLYEAIRFAN